MFRISENDNTIIFSFSSEMYLINRVIQTCGEYMNHLNISGTSEFRLVLRELLLNAVEHGNMKDAERLILCNIEYLGNWQFRIIVEDEGDGFDPKILNMKIPDNPLQIRKRGYATINAFTDRLEFNEKGNRITAYISIPQTTTFHIEKDSKDRQIITPSGDITASISEDFRAVLVELIDKGYRQYCFDFTYVKDIDSVALSVMIIFSKMLSRKNGKTELEIVNAEKGLTELFRMTRMDKIYKLRN